MSLLRFKSGTIALYVDLEREHARAAAVAAAETARGLGFSITVCDDRHAVLGLSTPGASMEEAVLLVTIGGDGTLLRAAQIAAPRGIPLFGVNTGRLGFLTEIDGDMLAVGLGELLRGECTVDTRTGLRVEVHGRSHFALNDVVLRRTTAHMAPFALEVDGKEAAHVPADGIAIATPTGSTAYFLSAGGPIIAPDVAAFGIVALLPHTLFTRPLVVPDTSIVTVSAVNTEASVEADGLAVDAVRPGDTVKVTRYPHGVRFARRAPLNFFSLLEEKMRWNAPIKERAGGE
jgi:NAD+ kinase